MLAGLAGLAGLAVLGIAITKPKTFLELAGRKAWSGMGRASDSLKAGHCLAAAARLGKANRNIGEMRASAESNSDWNAVRSAEVHADGLAAKVGRCRL
jgi:hypothetical protein